jgi:surface protein
MDCVTMVLVERETGLPLDLVVLINKFLPKILTDENFHQASDLWFENKEECKFRFGHISDWNTSRVTNMEYAFADRRDFNEDISRWDVGNVTNMSYMFSGASQFNCDISRWDVGRVTNMRNMFDGASQFNAEIGQWNVRNVTNINGMFDGASQFHWNLSGWDVWVTERLAPQVEGSGITIRLINFFSSS